MKIQMTALAIVAVFVLAPSARAQNVHVFVTVAQDATKTVYRYRVVNNSTQRIVSVQIGYDYPHGVYSLDVPPLGWSRDAGLPSSSVTSPAGWSATLQTTEETDVQNALDWRSAAPANDIMPGQSKSGFSATVAAPANAYINGVWTAVFGDTSDTSAALAAAGVFEVDSNPNVDTTPPSISVVLTPSQIWPPNHKMVRITAQIQVSDDQDPNPQVKLVSITSNEGTESDISGAAPGTDDREFFVRSERGGKQKQGRVYTVTYSATDAAGNVGVATATVTVPHDKGK
ncbi:MAG: hypothetical protein ACXW29_06360 [Thermoanaerobaculia bacterium]